MVRPGQYVRRGWRELWPGYFDCAARSLNPGGRACVQTIVIADELFERYRKGTDFIQQFIFPGGMLPSPSVFARMAGEHGLEVVDQFSFGIGYADTLAAWRLAFHAQLDEVSAQGFGEAFIQTWQFYLCYCEAAFRTRNTDVMHFTLVKSWWPPVIWVCCYRCRRFSCWH